eukprot:TRINITY_DN73443_c0_g1_i1.p1 TRINITY_DN73443_c0_g1~~TRINITY_DN73443_c0_g1_i1.p1  ORF type:complete len:330 (-),score=46.06 TRINITY_DN73443_c0_g1_i1:92-1081(-)
MDDDSLKRFAAARHSPPFTGAEQLAMYECSKELAVLRDRLGLKQKFEDIKNFGYCVLEPSPETIALADEIRPQVFMLLEEQKSKGPPYNPFEVPRLLGKGAEGPDGRSAFERYLMLPEQAALAEFMCGAGFILSQMTATYKTNAFDRHFVLPIHADQSWIPAPYPEHNLMLTCCLVTDDAWESPDGGPTAVVPRTHLLRRAPPTADAELMKLANSQLRPILAKKGSIVCWDGSVWHSATFRKTEAGARVVVHTSFCRLHVRPVEHYKLTVPDELLRRNPPLLASMCGRNDSLDHTLAREDVPNRRMYKSGLAGRRSAVLETFRAATARL